MPELKGKFDLRKFGVEHVAAMKRLRQTGEFDNMPDLVYTIGDGETEESIRNALYKDPDCGLDRFNEVNEDVFKRGKQGESLEGKHIIIPFWMVYRAMGTTRFSQPEVKGVLLGSSKTRVITIAEYSKDKLIKSSFIIRLAQRYKEEEKN